MTDRDDALIVLLGILISWWMLSLVLATVEVALAQKKEPSMWLGAAFVAFIAWHVYALVFVLRLAYEAAR